MSPLPSIPFVTRRSSDGYPVENFAGSQFPRKRGFVRFSSENDGYGSYTTEEWKDDPEGSLVTSMVEGEPFLHAPIFDVDRPVHLEENFSGKSVLVVPDVGRFVAWRVLRKVRNLQTVDAYYNRHERVLRIDLDALLILRSSKTTGHHHVYVEKLMSFDLSNAVARSLTPVIDAHYVRASGGCRAWYARV